MENNDEQVKQQEASKQQPVNMVEQVDSDHALAVALQEQESAYTTLESTESYMEDEDDEEEVGSSSSYGCYDGNFESQAFEAELEFIEDDGEGSYSDEIEEDDIDPDEMSYEELIALGEIVGEENRGLSVEEISSSLSPYVYKNVHRKSVIDRCVVCQIEYEEGEQLAALKCEHPFHTECINQWLQIKKVCPICLIEVTPRSNLESLKSDKIDT